MKTAIVIMSSAFLFACATNQPTDGSAGTGTGTTDFLSSLLTGVAGKEVDKHAKIRNMEVTQKLGNTVNMNISYGDLYNFDGMEIRAKALNNGTRLAGVQSTAATPTGINGSAEVALTWADAQLGQSLRSNQIMVEILRDGKTIKSRTFTLNKQWSALTTPDFDAPAPVATPGHTPTTGTPAVVTKPPVLIAPVRTPVASSTTTIKPTTATTAVRKPAATTTTTTTTSPSTTLKSASPTLLLTR